MSNGLTDTFSTVNNVDSEKYLYHKIDTETSILIRHFFIPCIDPQRINHVSKSLNKYLPHCYMVSKLIAIMRICENPDLRNSVSNKTVTEIILQKHARYDMITYKNQ